MKRNLFHKTIYFMVTLALTFSLCSCSFFGRKDKNEENTEQRGEFSGAVNSDYVRTAPGVSADMLDPEFWIQGMKDPDAIIMKEADIKELNDHIVADLLERGLFAFDLSKPAQVFTDGRRSDLVKSCKIPRRAYYMNGEQLPKSYWKPIIENANGAAVRANHYQYGIAVVRSDLRSYPTDDLINSTEDNLDSDTLQISDVLMNEPLLIVHTSKDGQWYYAFSEICMGWIKSSDVAICEDYEAMLAATNIEDFVVYTGNTTELCVDDSQPEVSRLKLFMGTRLEVVPVDRQPEVVGRRYVYDNYVVKVPVRGEGGRLEYRYTLLPVNEDVSFGYLPYTGRNLIELMFKSLGDRYGWGGMNDLRDCSLYTREVYKCFGFSLPRNSANQAEMDCTTIHWEKDTTSEKKYSDLEKVEPGAIIRLPGHVMFYLGKVGDEHFVISAAGSFDPDGGGEAIRVRTVVVNSLEMYRSDGGKWVDAITDVKILK